MPRIDAASIQEHVRLQTGRILDAAMELFHARGYAGTSIDDIAQAVGLARNSLYRYYQNKDYILLACVSRDMSVYVERMRGLAAEYPDAAERMGAWLDMQIDIATSPVHAKLEMMAEIRNTSPDLRREIMVLHQAPAKVLEDTVAQRLKGSRRDVALITSLIGGMVEAAAMQAMRRENRAATKRELRRSVEAMLTA